MKNRSSSRADRGVDDLKAHLREDLKKVSDVEASAQEGTQQEGQRSWNPWTTRTPKGDNRDQVATVYGGLETTFGMVTDKAVQLNVRKGLFAGTSQQIVPIQDVTSVRLETSRHGIWGILFIIAGLALTIYGVGAVLLAIGALLLWGWPKVAVNTQSGDRRSSVGWPWKRKEASKFTDTLRNELLKRG